MDLVHIMNHPESYKNPQIKGLGLGGDLEIGAMEETGGDDHNQDGDAFVPQSVRRSVDNTFTNQATSTLTNLVPVADGNPLTNFERTLTP